MIVTLCTERIRTLDDIRAFLDGNEVADITPRDRGTAYAFIERVLVRFRYHFGLSRAGKGLVREFLAKATGYSDAQLCFRCTKTSGRETPPDPRNDIPVRRETWADSGSAFVAGQRTRRPRPPASRPCAPMPNSPASSRSASR